MSALEERLAWLGSFDMPCDDGSTIRMAPALVERARLLAQRLAAEGLSLNPANIAPVQNGSILFSLCGANGRDADAWLTEEASEVLVVRGEYGHAKSPQWTGDEESLSADVAAPALAAWLTGGEWRGT